MDLWEDVSSTQELQDTHQTLSRTKSAPKAGTLGRFNSQDLLQPTPIAVEPKTVKRTKSLWRFRSKKSDILEGMALWKHRSLIDVNEVAQNEVELVKTEETSDEDEKENIYSSAEELKDDGVESVIFVEDHVNRGTVTLRRKIGDKKSGSFDHLADNATLKRKTLDRNSSLEYLDTSNETAQNKTNREERDDRSLFRKNVKIETLSRKHVDNETLLRKHADDGTSQRNHVDDHRTGSLLPRTKLIKSSSNGVENVRDAKKKEVKTWNVARKNRESKWIKEDGGTVKYGPWYDLWGIDASVKT